MTEAPIEFIVRLRGGAEAAADAKRIEGAVRGMGGQVKRMGDESAIASRKSSAFGGSLKHVAFGLGAVALGFGAYSKAKQAIDYTIGLTRTSTALSKATGLSVGESSKLAAVSEALGVNSTKLAAVFTKVGAATVKQAEHTGKGATAFDRLGISQDFAKKHLNDTAGVLDAVTHAFVSNHIPALERSKMLTELFGRAWLPLGPLFLEGETNFKHLTGLAKEFGLELGGGTKELTKLKQQQEEYTLSTMGLKVAFTQVVAGPLGNMLSGFAKLVVYAKAGQWGKFNKEVESIARQFETLAEKVLPKMAEGFARVAPAVLKAFWRGFSHASLGAQALMAGVLATKFGLTGGIFRGIGMGLGRSVAGGMVAEDAAVASAGSKLGAAFGFAFAAVAVGYITKELLSHFGEGVSSIFSASAEGQAAELKNPLIRRVQEHNERLESHPLSGNALKSWEANRRTHPISFREWLDIVGGGHPKGTQRSEDLMQYRMAMKEGKLPGKAAMGGTVMSSGLVEVGERGREVLSLPAGAQVTPLKPGSLLDNRPIILKVDGKVLARVNRRETLQWQAAGS